MGDSEKVNWKNLQAVLKRYEAHGLTVEKAYPEKELLRCTVPQSLLVVFNEILKNHNTHSTFERDSHIIYPNSSTVSAAEKRNPIQGEYEHTYPVIRRREDL